MKKGFLVLLMVALVAPLFARDIDAVVSADWLAANLSNSKLVVLDVRKIEDYKVGHIPGAVSSIAASWSPKKGNLNAELPDVGLLEDLIMEAGIDGSNWVVIANSEGGSQYHASARVALTLMYAGLDNVAILDGGMAVWTKAGKPVATGVETRKESDFTAKLRPEFLVSQDYVVENIGKTQFLDARSYDGYFGRTKFANAVQFGHIPGAFSLPKEWLYDAEGKLVPDAKIKEMLAAIGLDTTKEFIGYCDTGMGCAIFSWVFGEKFGWKNVKMYDGSSEELTRNPKVTYTMYSWR